MTRIISLLTATALAAPAHAASHRFHADHVLGTSLDMVVAGASDSDAQAALGAARAEIGRLDLILSGWRHDSELAALNRASGPFTASPELFHVIAACEAWRAACQGAFSPRLGAVEATWREAETAGAAPNAERLTRLARQAEAADVRLDPASLSIDRDGVIFAIDAYAKGYIIDKALAAARQAAPSVGGIMLDIGGDVACFGAPVNAPAWRFGIADGGQADNLVPQAVLILRGGAVATSGSAARDRIIGGAAYSHLLSPESGAAAPARLVTVAAPMAKDADALATAFALMPAPQAISLANERPGVEARIVNHEGEVFTSAGWPAAAAPVRPLPVLYQAAPKAPASNAWPAGYEVKIDYEIPVLTGGRVKVPFVAIFVTDESDKLVRTITHLGDHPPRFLDSNYLWYGPFTSKGGQLASVTRPSRAPGKYSVVWDGKDDAGNPVRQGKYTIKIEVSREHGGHSIQAIPLTLGAAPVSGSAAAQAESGAATATYGKSQ